ncbi:MAG TPA: insulinase family protein, partial [Sphingomonas sanguinis]|nr:insulinase family protein [Sphingomonas sanguinis]
MAFPSRAMRSLALSALLGLAIPVIGQVPQAQPSQPRPTDNRSVPQGLPVPVAVVGEAADPLAPLPPIPGVDQSPWLYKGSDLPQDKMWKFGRLANGLRFAVRRNGVPPGQVAVRVR